MDNTNILLFDEATHQYTVNGKPLISTTSLLKMYGLSVNYGSIPANVLAKAANRGKAIHKELELFIKGTPSGLGNSAEVTLLDQYIQTRGINLGIAKAEQQVFDINYAIAGTIDFQYLDGNDTVIADFKTTSALHITEVAWQLSIYNYMVTKGDTLSYYINKLKVFHFNQGRLLVKDVPTIAMDAVESLLNTYKAGGTTFVYNVPTVVITDSQSQLIKMLADEIESYDQIKTKLEKELDAMLQQVKDNMRDQKYYNYDCPDYTLTYIHPQLKRTLNTKAVREFFTKNNVSIDPFISETKTGDSIRLRLKPQGNNTKPGGN